MKAITYMALHAGYRLECAYRLCDIRSPLFLASKYKK
jgi:hypothetical protein